MEDMNTRHNYLSENFEDLLYILILIIISMIFSKNN